jgi:hypothetical protein
VDAQCGLREWIPLRVSIEPGTGNGPKSLDKHGAAGHAPFTKEKKGHSGTKRTHTTGTGN